MKLGVCYYPEHWPEAWWADDARHMREMGIAVVRIAEFAWSRIEPEAGHFDWGWLDRAVETLHAAGLKVVMCTPTATPPKWLVDADPGMLAVDAAGVPRGFGSRRHYCFSSLSYREQSVRICRLVAQRYGQHPAVVAWQTDNEYGCHDTVLSYSAAARAGFRRWLRARYMTVEALNHAWGTVFWSQEVRSFEQVDPPVATVTEANPAHRLDYRRFSSDEVVAFNRAQVAVLRECSPGRDLLHNFMGFFTEFDHHDLAADLDVATWDSYPLGFTQNFFFDTDEKRAYARTGHPDIPAFHHDLYRGMCQGVNRNRWWVMEQQPGPVNWARWNPAPADGMVRLWTWQAFAHGAEVVSYFRWRQAPFAQEQMHTGLLRPDRSMDQGGVEAMQVARELLEIAAAAGDASDAGAARLSGDVLPDATRLGQLARRVPARTALVFDYPSLWMAQIQPQGADYNALELSFRVYSALRQLGIDVDIVPSRADLSLYRLVVLPAHLRSDALLAAALTNNTAQVVFGPRCGAKTASLSIPNGLPPGDFASLAGVRVRRVASLPPGVADRVRGDEIDCSVSRWREDLDLQGAQAVATFDDGNPAVTRCGRTRYVAGWLADAGWTSVLRVAAINAGIEPVDLPRDVRISRLGELMVVCNFSDAAVRFAPPEPAACLLGGKGNSDELAPRALSVWKLKTSDSRVA